MFEFKVANKYAVAARVDNYSVPGLRMAVSGYYGHSIDNTTYRESSPESLPRKLKGVVAIGAFDFTYNAHNWIARGNVDYGYLGDAKEITNLPKRQTSTGPYQKTPVGSHALAYGVEAGYDIFSRFNKLRDDNQKLYVFGRYEYYDSYIPSEAQKKGSSTYDYTDKKRFAVGLNYYPIPQIVVKAEYSKRLLKSQYNDEPSFSLGIAYQGFFTK